MTRLVNQAARDLITEFEGVRLVPYQDSVGNWTWGIGHKKGPDEKVPVSITQDQCNDLFEQDLSNASDTCGKYITVALGDNQFGALCSLVYNLGNSPLTHTLGKFLNEGLYASASEQFLRWVYAGYVISDGLVRRRAAEKALFDQPDS